MKGDLFGAAKLHGEAGTCYRKISAPMAVEAYLRLVLLVVFRNNLIKLPRLKTLNLSDWKKVKLQNEWQSQGKRCEILFTPFLKFKDPFFPQRTGWFDQIIIFVKHLG